MAQSMGFGLSGHWKRLAAADLVWRLCTDGLRRVDLAQQAQVLVCFGEFHSKQHLVLHAGHGLAVDEQRDLSILVPKFSGGLAVVQRIDQPALVPEHDHGCVGKSALVKGTEMANSG